MSHSEFSKQAQRQIAEHQRAWAELREIEVDSNAMVGTAAENLFQELSPETRTALEANRPEQFGEPGKPSEGMRLDSTTALVCNVFDYWRGRDCAPLGVACGFAGSECELRFGELLPVAPAVTDATAPPIDVLLRAADSKPIAVVASFSEPYRTRNDRRAHHFDFFTRPGLWGPLQDCRGLALDRAANPRRYLRLDVASLLKQILALSNHYGARGFLLLHLWYDVPGHASLELRREIDRFRMRVGGEVDFDSLSWQNFSERFRPHCSEHLGYAAYLGARYFPRNSAPMR